MSDRTESNLNEQIENFQKLWTETFSRIAQNAFAFTPDSAPPEILRQIRSGIFQALAQSWDEYLRSPQFMEGMKQWMDSAIMFRKMTNDFMTKARHETQDIAREDIDSVMLAVRHMEKRILDRIEDLSARVDKLSEQVNRVKPNGALKTTSTAAAKPGGTRRTGRARPEKEQS
jgi:hypothetical protein